MRVEAGGGQRVAQLVPQPSVAAGDDQRGAALQGLRRMGRTREAGDRAGAHPLGHERAGKGPERRRQALGDHQHAGAGRNPPAVCGEDRGQRPGRDGEADQVLGGQLELGGPAHVHRVGEPHAGKVPGVLALAGHLVGLLGAATAEVHLQARSGQGDGQGGAT